MNYHCGEERATTRDCPYKPSCNVGAILYGCPHSGVGIQKINNPEERATTRDCPYKPSCNVGAILYGCPHPKAVRYGNVGAILYGCPHP